MSLAEAGASMQAHHLARMRVCSRDPTSPSTPTTPIAPSHLGGHEENVMEDLQLAAELGKTLLERNRELESSLKLHQNIVEDQVQEIEYLSKQTTALREVNESRLRIYEQLEISIQELEKNNQRLGAEGNYDKKKIKSLSETVQSLEVKIEDLQKQLEEVRNNNEPRGRNRKKILILEDHLARRSISCDICPQDQEDQSKVQKTQVEELQQKLKDENSKTISEIKKREELEIELACMSQANGLLQDQLCVMGEQQINLQSFGDELNSIDDDSSARICSKCMGNVDETSSNATIYDLNDIEDNDVALQTQGECALVKFQNGGYAWGSQESLASMGGQIVSGSCGGSPDTIGSDAPQNSLLFELDTQYRVLIDKYEALLAVREQQQISLTQLTSNSPQSLNNSGENTDEHNNSSCQKCVNCSSKIKLETSSEMGTLSSGISIGEYLLFHKFTQTEDYDPHDDAITPTPAMANRCLNLTSPLNPCNKRFQATPEYKKLFQEIFTVLKKNVEENDKKSTAKIVEQNILSSQIVQSKLECKDDKNNLALSSNDQENKLPLQKLSSNEVNARDESVIKVCQNECITIEQSLVGAQCTGTKLPDASPKSSDESPSNDVEFDGYISSKPPRPISLDLVSNSSRSSSKSRRKKRNRKMRAENVQSQSQSTQQSTENNGTRQRTAGENVPATQKSSHDDFPKLDKQNEQYESRTIYSSNRGRCERHRSRRNREYGSNQQQFFQFQNQSSAGQSYQHQLQHPQSLELPQKPANKSKINYPSVEVARLRKLEMSYAQVLKNALNRNNK